MLNTNVLWKRALVWLLVLGPGFFLIYGSVNHFTATREPVDSLFLSIERSIPVVQWHILPYMLLDLMFAASLFMCRSKLELDQHAKRLAAGIVIASVCFLLWPLKFGFERPDMNGFWGILHDQLTGFDLPYNQAPSLHIILLVLVGIIFLRHLPRWTKFPTLVWCALIAVSVLTTHQHHSIDIITAIPVTLFCLALFPDHPENQTSDQTATSFQDTRAHDDSHWVGYLYLFLTIVSFAIGALLGFWGALLVIPGLACALMAVIYLLKDERILQKQADGSTSWLIKSVLFPVTWVQLIYKRWYSSKVNLIDEVIDGVYISRRLSTAEFKHEVGTKQINTLIDLAPEFSAPSISKDMTYVTLNWLDLAPVRLNQLNVAADHLADAKKRGNVLIKCKLGLQRSALVVLAYLIKYENFTVEDAFSLVSKKRQGAVLRQRQTALLAQLHE